MLKRAAEINARADVLHWITEIRVFGSYEAGAADLGDIDLAIDIRRRPTEDYVKACIDMADESGRRFSNYVERLYYAETLMKKLLKNRSRHISVHDARELPPEPQFRGTPVYVFEPPSAEDAPRIGP